MSTVIAKGVVAGIVNKRAEEAAFVLCVTSDGGRTFISHKEEMLHERIIPV
jgi:hypothetical protein